MKTRNIAGLHLAVAAALSMYCISSVADEPTLVHVQEAEGPTDFNIKMDQTTIPSGPVAFDVTNHSKTLEHEFVIVKTDLPQDKLPYDKKAQRVEEDKLNVVGEVDDLGPGTAGARTFDLEPGHYVAICNEPDHYAHGMHIAFTVVK